MVIISAALYGEALIKVIISSHTINRCFNKNVRGYAMKGKLVLICCFDGSLTKAQIDCIYKRKCQNTGRELQLILPCNSRKSDWYERLLEFLWQKSCSRNTVCLTQLEKMNRGSVAPRLGVENAGDGNEKK